MKIGLEKVNTYEGVSVRALLDSRATELFVDKKFVEKYGFKREQLAKPLKIRNIDGIDNSGGVVTHEIECNMYFKGYIERVQIDVYNLERTEVILGMLWLAVHNPEINWEKGEVMMTKCPLLCGKNKRLKKEKEQREVRTNKKEKDIKTVEKLVPKRFWK